MASKNLVEGLIFSVHRHSTNSLCLGCVSGKAHRSPFPAGRTRANQVGQLIQSDVCGPFNTETPGGARYFVVFIDDFSGWRAVFFLKRKSEVTNYFKNFVAALRSETGYLVHTLRTDNGGEFRSTELQSWLTDRGIRLETSAPYSPEQNGVSERANRTIVEAARSVLHAKELPLELWGEAVSYVIFTLNRVANSSDITPYQLWYGAKPAISHLRVFGSSSFVHVPKAERSKLDSKTIKCYFVGYSLTQKAYRFWDPVRRVIKISRDALIDEHTNYFHPQSQPAEHADVLPPAPIFKTPPQEPKITLLVE